MDYLDFIYKMSLQDLENYKKALTSSYIWLMIILAVFIFNCWSIHGSSHDWIPSLSAGVNLACIFFIFTMSCQERSDIKITQEKLKYMEQERDRKLADGELKQLKSLVEYYKDRINAISRGMPDNIANAACHENTPPESASPKAES